jgi:hypothetical protein
MPTDKYKGKSQYEKFKAAAREHGTDQSEASFEDALRRIAKAAPAKPKAPKKRGK